MSNKALNTAQRDIRDEFYTRMDDIENELFHYRKYFREKTILCNCDKPDRSDFYHYFKKYFNVYGLKKLIVVGYLDRDGETGLLYDSDIESNYVIESGDFRSHSNQLLLKEADIVITNPPFSLFREYMESIFNAKKDFIVLSDLNHFGYKIIRDKIIAGNIFPGVGRGLSMWFDVPDNYRSNIGGRVRYIDEGKQISFGRMYWLTNLHTGILPDFIDTGIKYKKKNYRRYDDYDIIEVGRVDNIPMDYSGKMGVPMSFMRYYNPKQFELLGYLHNPKIDGRGKHKRFVIRFNKTIKGANNGQKT